MKKVTKANCRIIYMGTPAMSAHVLENLIADGWNIVGLVCKEDKEVGRKRILTSCPTKNVALKHNIPIFQPHRIRLDYEFVKELKPDLILTFAYGQIIPQGLLDIPPLGCLNLHGSLLPLYRGAAPIQRAIMDGKKETGITLMEMIDKMDAGKMYAKSVVTIECEDNYTSLCEKLEKAAFNICKDYLPLYLDNKLIGEVQDENKVTIANKIKPEDEKLNLTNEAKQFINHLRALANEPGAYLYLNNLKFKIFKARKIDESINYDVGTLLINKDVRLQLKDGLILLEIIQLEGKKMMDSKAFANGNKAFDKIVLK